MPGPEFSLQRWQLEIRSMCNRRNIRRWSFLFAVATLSTCGGETEPEVVDLSGSYLLLNAQLDGQPPLFPPLVEGTLVLTQTTFDLFVESVVPGIEPFDVSGTYSIDDGRWLQESDGEQVEGTYAVNGTQLTVDTTLGGQHMVSVWEKQG